MVHQLDFQGREIRLYEIAHDLWVHLLDLHLNVLVFLNVLPDDDQRPLRLLASANELIFVLRDDGQVGIVPIFQLLAQLRRTIVEASEHILDVLDATILVLRNLLEKTLLFLCALLRQDDRVCRREVPGFLELLLQDPVALGLLLDKMLPHARHDVERHRHVAARVLQKILQLVQRRLEVHLGDVEHRLNLEQRRRLGLAVSV
mmetsp:Transcript_66768/g.204314  ORF Transcript_66768/g.204314 Transcript_66768/m.204314 type:complete len:203 (-) Transcript_66768:2805-3413(-)